MPPAADLEFTVEPGIALLCVPEKLRFAEQQRRIVDAEVDAVSVPQLRVAGSGSGRVSVQHRAKQGQVVADVGAQPRPHRGQWGGWPAARKIDCRYRRPA